MSRDLEVLFAPAEFAALQQRDLSRTVCVVFDVLRATSTMITALAAGAQAIIPVLEIDDALKLRAEIPDCLLAGERDGLRITPDQTGGVRFDFGNSPREFFPENVRGRTIVMTTTNGTRALRACLGAREIWVGSFLNLSALGRQLAQSGAEQLLVVCGGTKDQAALEDTLAAGGLCELVWKSFAPDEIADSARIARDLYLRFKDDLFNELRRARNARRLLTIPELHDDVAFVLQRDRFDLSAQMDRDGIVRATR